MSTDAYYEAWEQYLQYLETTPRPERRRILKDHYKRADQGNRAKAREALRVKTPTIDVSDLPYMKGI
jgi:hypothetical protein